MIKGFRLHFASSTHYLESSESDFVLITSPNERTHVLTNLQPWTTYNVSVQPFNGKYYGKKATWRLAFMPQVAPSAPPTSVEKTTDNEQLVFCQTFFSSVNNATSTNDCIYNCFCIHMIVFIS